MIETNYVPEVKVLGFKMVPILLSGKHFMFMAAWENNSSHACP